MRILSVNSNGLNDQKIERIAKLVNHRNIFVVFIQEFKRSNIPPEFLACFSPEKWRYIFSPFEAKSNIQGLVSLIKISSEVQVSQADLSIKSKGILQHAFECSDGTTTVSMLNVYWPPSAWVDENLIGNLVNFDISIGDFNLNTADRNTKIEQFCLDNNRINLIDFPTFLPHNSTSRASNLTDAAIVKPETAITVTDHGILSDHALLVLETSVKFGLNLAKDHNSKKSHHHFDYSKITEEINFQFWNDLPSYPCYADIQTLKRKFLTHCRVRHFPKTNKETVDLEYHPDITTASTVDEQEGNSALSSFWSNATDQLNECKDLGLVFKTIKTFKSGQACEIKPEAKFSRRDDNKSLKKFKSRVCKVERLNKNEYSKYKRIMTRISSVLKKNPSTFSFSAKQVEEELKLLNTNAAPGPDSFQNEFFPRHVVGYQKLANFFNAYVSDQNGIFLERQLKACTLKFIPKDSGGTRPLSLASRLLSLLDRLVNRLFLNFINLSDRLDNRFAFRKNVGCEDAIGKVCEFIQKNREENKLVSIAQLDLSAAFNFCGHKRIILKIYELLTEIGLNKDRDSVWTIMYVKDWFCRDILFEKTQFRLRRGVPQGSPLSPSLFNICFSWDVDDETGNIRIVFYADDISLCVAEHALPLLQGLMNNILRNFMEWSSGNEFLLNFDKSKILTIGLTGSKKLVLDAEFREIELVKNVRILGVWFDNTFCFEYHYKKLKSYIRPRAIAIRQLRNLGLSEHNLKCTVLALRQKLAYGLYQLVHMSTSMFVKISRLFNELVRAWTEGSVFVPLDILFEQAGINNFRDFVDYQLASRFILKGKSFRFFNHNIWSSEVNPEIERLPLSPPDQKLTMTLRSSTVKKTEESIERALEKLKKADSKKFGPVNFVRMMGEVKLGKIEKVSNLCLPPDGYKNALKRVLEIENMKLSREAVEKRKLIFGQFKDLGLQRMGVGDN